MGGVVGTAIYIRMRLQTMQRRGGSCSRRALAVWNGRLADNWNRAAIANVKLLRDLPLPLRQQGSLRVIGAPPPALAREEPPPARLVSPSTYSTLLYYMVLRSQQQQPRYSQATHGALMLIAKKSVHSPYLLHLHTPRRKVCTCYT